MNTNQCDVLIVGCGIAGLSTALYLTETSPDLQIIVLHKGGLPETNTRLAQGGIAAVMDTGIDSPEQHIEDTLQSGGQLCDRHIVELVVREAPDRIRDLIRWGVYFDHDENEQSGFHLNREGGHTAHRILHQKDFTGLEIHRNLLRLVQAHHSIKIISHAFANDILLKGESVFGLNYYDETSKQPKHLLSRAVMLATGGCGQLFSHTTNNLGATGDGTAIALRAGAVVHDLQYYQFHPTVLYQQDSEGSFLISEAVRGAGGHVVNADGRRFLFDYDLRGELATRDVVTAAIRQEMMRTQAKYVYLSVRHLDMLKFARQFPTIWDKCLSIGLDLTHEDIPIVPAAHYQCGGIWVDEYGQSSIERLYAGGECARTGLHGANRLASNSLIEAMVFARRSADHIIKNIRQWEASITGEVLPAFTEDRTIPDLKRKKQSLQIQMDQIFSKPQNDDFIEKALLRIDDWMTDTSIYADQHNREAGEYLNLLGNAKCCCRELLASRVSKSFVDKIT